MFLWVDFIPESKQVFDKDGFLLCRDVPVARTGTQIYGPGETPIECADGQVVHIERTEDEVFHPDTLASLIGVPVVNDHPVDGEGNRCDVTPDNWRHLAVGHVENPRRGEGEFGDFVLADLRIHDGDAILLIKSGKRQVSAGYDADYEELGPLHGRQKSIRCNHLALVDAARCGPMCMISDGKTFDEDYEDEELEEESMTTTSWHDRIRGLAKQYGFKARDAAELESAIADAEEGENGNGNGNGAVPGQHVHVHMPPANGATDQEPDPDDKDKDKTEDGKTRDLETEEVWQALENLERAIVTGETGDAYKPRDSWPHRDARRRRMGIDNAPPMPDPDKTVDEPGGPDLLGGKKAILREYEMEAPAGSQVVDVAKARDSAFLEDSWSETCSLAEIMVPGIRIPTFDRAAAPQNSYTAMTNFRRRALDLFYVHPEGRDLIDDETRGRFKNASALSGAEVRQLFRTVGRTKRMMNNASHGLVTGRAPAQDAPVAAGGAKTLAEYQKQINEFYDNRAQHQR